MPISTEFINLSHSLVTNKYPAKWALEDDKLRVLKLEETDLTKLGLFNDASPDFNTYYPDVKPEDLVPTDGEFSFPLFRGLSATRVNKFGPINFSKNNVVKKSLKKIIGQSVYTNHEVLVGNEIGVVFEAVWQEEYKTKNGITIPGGINVRLKLDGKSNPKLVRNINMDPPAVHSVSVGVEFAWEQSHPALSREEFWRLLGTYDEKGEMIERVVTEILNYHEISLVPHGADPFAQKVQEKTGEINNPEYAVRQGKMQFTVDLFTKYGSTLDWQNHHLSFSTIPDKPNLNKPHFNSNAMNEQELAFWRAKLGLSATATQAEVLAKLQANLPGWEKAVSDLAIVQQTLTNLQAKYPEGTEVLTAENKAKLAKHDAIVQANDAHLSAERTETLRLYHLSIGGADKADAALVKVISEGNLESVQALQKQYATAVDTNFPMSCGACGSHDVKRASSSPTGKDNPAPEKAKSNFEVSQALNKGNAAAASGTIHA